jgi:hypothetical protein
VPSLFLADWIFARERFFAIRLLFTRGAPQP